MAISFIQKYFPCLIWKQKEMKGTEGLDKLMTTDKQNLFYGSGQHGEVTLDDFSDFLETLQKNPDYKQDLEDHAKFMEQISPYLHMTKEEMIKVIPDGLYDISSGKWRMHTGKMGFINLIITYKNYGKEKK